MAEPGSFHGGGGAGHAPAVLVDHARRHNAKRGANADHVSLDAEAVFCADDFGALDEALKRWRRGRRAKAKVVKLRFLGGLSVEEPADSAARPPRV